VTNVVTDLNLGHWQERLDTHFRELAVSRKSAFPDWPIFALENGLDLRELEWLANTLRLHLATNARRSERES